MILGEKVPEMLIRRFHKNQSYCRSYTHYNDDALPFHQSLPTMRQATHSQCCRTSMADYYRCRIVTTLLDESVSAASQIQPSALA